MRDLHVPEIPRTRVSRDVSFGDERYKEPRRTFPWKKTVTGKRALCLLYIYAVGNFGTDDQFIHHKPSELSLTGEGALLCLKTHCPEIFAEYLSRTGNELTADIIMSRYANMWRSNDRKNFELGPEHPKNHPDLQPVLNEMMFYKRDFAKKNGWF